ncbi:hypothetical protein [Rhodopirellula sallentina]|uniref:hypothetical protein n=1 Tax=Rhodopirellula sallentina TaxID=1263869 RepID=UPI00034A4B62|nr:hypothetical protein [Rhodopirellula sallentina]
MTGLKNRVRRSLCWGGIVLIVLATVGCGGESLVRVPADDAEFSSPADYEQYDQEMHELSVGQTE